MKLVTYSHNGSTSCAILTEAGLIDIPQAWERVNPPHSVKEILLRGHSCLSKLIELEGYDRRRMDEDQVRYGNRPHEPLLQPAMAAQI